MKYVIFVFTIIGGLAAAVATGWFISAIVGSWITDGWSSDIGVSLFFAVVLGFFSLFAMIGAHDLRKKQYNQQFRTQNLRAYARVLNDPFVHMREGTLRTLHLMVFVQGLPPFRLDHSGKELAGRYISKYEPGEQLEIVLLHPFDRRLM